jgi:restriction system protein
MAVPKYYEFFPAVMECLRDGKEHTSKEISDYCSEYFKLSPDDLSEKLKSGQTVFLNRIGWARTYLSKGGLIEKSQRAVYKLTSEGRKAVQGGCEKITFEYLMKYKSFNDFAKRTFNKKEYKQTEQPLNTDKSPAELLEYAVDQLNANLADELLETVMNISPFEFEHLVVKLLIEMGYGTLEVNKDAVTKKTGDEAIDGIVSADKFGFDSIYIQAKQWKRDTVISRPEIQKFLGALAGQGAEKGIFITTAQFSKEAINYAAKQLNIKIILVNGDQLAKLMIEYNLGVSTVSTYTVKRIDSDFFNEDV